MTARLWTGNAELRKRLVPVDQLRTHPRNARRGDIDAIAASLERFGQQRAALALPDGTIVAGNHSYLAARKLGWTHYAVDRSDLEDDEVTAYLIADNRTSDLGTYDLPLLAGLIAPFANNLSGLGFSSEDYEALISAAAGAHAPEAKPKAPPKGDSVSTLFLPYPTEQYDQVTRYLNMIAREWETDVSGVVLQLAKTAAASL